MNANNAVHYGCTPTPSSPSNCTSEELTLIQWGNSGITNNPQIGYPNYNPASLTMADWGEYPLPFVPQAPEYGFWATKAFGDVPTLNKV
jgi:hypothetical protein